MFPGYSHRIGKMQHTKLKLILLSLNDPIFVGYCYNNLNLLFVLFFNGFHNKNEQHEMLFCIFRVFKKTILRFWLKTKPNLVLCQMVFIQSGIRIAIFLKDKFVPKVEIGSIRIGEVEFGSFVVDFDQRIGAMTS